MITLGRYLIGSYCRVFFLAISVFILLLLLSRLHEIAHFIALGTEPMCVLFFIIHQIPYLLPFAAAISSLLAAFTLFTRLSEQGELTTLRFSGLSLGYIVTPILLTAALFSCASFYLTSECATTSHLKTRKMVYDVTSVNPLLLLTSARIPKLKTAYVQMDPAKRGKCVSELFIAYFNPKTARINCLLADKIEVDENKLSAQNLSLISSSPKDHALLIENQSEVTSSSKELAHMLRTKGYRIANDHLTLPLLRLRKREFKNIANNTDSPKVKHHSLRGIQKCDSEILRRATLALSPFTFTLLGIAQGISISRRKSRARLLFTALLGMLSLATFFVAKELASYFTLAATLFLLPHFIIIVVASFSFYRIKRGIE